MSLILKSFSTAKTILYSPFTTQLRSVSVNFPLNYVKKTASNASALAISKKLDDDKSIFNNVNNLLNNENVGRIFAVVQLCGKQFKITSGDIILVEGHWAPTIGDRICLEKVLVAGCNDFTLIGRPLLQPGICDVQATIIEKTLTHTKTHFRKKRRKQYMRINFFRSPNTMIRINSINVCENIDKIKTKDEPLKLF